MHATYDTCTDFAIEYCQMYNLKPYYDSSAPVDLPTCMYRIQSIHDTSLPPNKNEEVCVYGELFDSGRSNVVGDNTPLGLSCDIETSRDFSLSRVFCILFGTHFPRGCLSHTCMMC